jgi:hypothetical protein
MNEKLFAIVVFFLFASMFGCGVSVNFDADSADQDPLKDAFDEKDLGKPLNIGALDQKDQEFVGALMMRDAVKAKAALDAGAKVNIDCGHGCTTLMLAGATGDSELVEKIRKAGVQETPDAQHYLEILEFAKRAEEPKFKAALAEIAKITGVQPVPSERAGVFKISLQAEAAKAFLEKHHEPFLNNGCYLVLYEQKFGLNGPDTLWILPTKNKFAVMAITDINGCNYGIENLLVIRWMNRLNNDQPFFLTGCGMDFMSGRFCAKIKDPNAMAKRMYKFCPDIVDQGTETEKNLGDELGKNNEFFFWWD